MKIPTTSQLAKINKTALAEKHDVTQGYVSMILYGKRKHKTKKAQAILEDAHRIIKVLEGETITQD